MNHLSRSQKLFEQATKLIPGGVNSPVRAFGGVGGTPLFFKRAQGAFLYDEDDRCYTDYVGSWGPMIIGHNHPAVVTAIVETVTGMGTSFGAPCALEVAMAEQLCRMVPSLEMVRMVSSGTEATMTAIRLARGYTRRSLILKFQGGYHGHADCLLCDAGSAAASFGTPTSAGVPEAVVHDTLTLPYNDLDALEQLFCKHGDHMAAVIIEPVAGNMGCILPQAGFLEILRTLCHQHGTILIFDEVMTGFRVARGGAGALFGIQPDLTTLGKVIGGGLPVGAVGGRADIMQHLSPLGPVYQAGTLSGNPLAMAAGLATLQLLEQETFYEALTQKTQHLVQGLLEAAKDAGVPIQGTCVGGMFGISFTRSPVRNLLDIKRSRTEAFKLFFHSMLRQGHYFAPHVFEAGFVSQAHDQAIIDDTLQAARGAFEEIAAHDSTHGVV